jgi:hypothetical protein
LVGKVFGVDVRGFGDGFIFYFYGEEGCAGDGGGTALAEEAGLGDAIRCGVQAGGEIEDVAADWVGDVDGGCGVGKFSSVARGFEVVEDGVAEHCLSIPRVSGSGNALKFEPGEGLKTS